jgi:hypothetical protein
VVETPLAVDAKVDAKGSAVFEFEKHLLADGSGLDEFLTGDEFGARGEPTLW